MVASPGLTRLTVTDVVEADHAHVVRYPPAGVGNPLLEADGEQVVVGDHRQRRVGMLFRPRPSRPPASVGVGTDPLRRTLTTCKLLTRFQHPAPAHAVGPGRLRSGQVGQRVVATVRAR